MVNGINTVLELQMAITGKQIADEDQAMAIITKSVYKGTACGAYIVFKDDGVILGSIVEGCYYGTEDFYLRYPFTLFTFWLRLTEIEDEANDIWNDTHGCDSCNEPDPDGFVQINPSCKNCDGFGIIL